MYPVLYNKLYQGLKVVGWPDSIPLEYFFLTLYCTIEFTLSRRLYCTNSLHCSVHWIVHFTVNSTMQGRQSGWPIFLTNLPSLPSDLYSFPKHYTVNCTLHCSVQYCLQLTLNFTVHFTASLTVRRWPICSGKLPSLPPLQCTAYFTARCTIHPNEHFFFTIYCTLYCTIYCTP